MNQPVLKKITENPWTPRPWGIMRIIHEDERYWVKVIRIAPCQQISLQTHANRDEVWTITQGEGLATLIAFPKTLKNGNKMRVNTGHTVSIPKGVKHRIKNLSATETLEFIEVATGRCDEADIVRYADDYDRPVLPEP